MNSGLVTSFSFTNSKFKQALKLTRFEIIWLEVSILLLNDLPSLQFTITPVKLLGMKLEAGVTGGIFSLKINRK